MDIGAEGEREIDIPTTQEKEPKTLGLFNFLSDELSSLIDDDKEKVSLWYLKTAMRDIEVQDSFYTTEIVYQEDSEDQEQKKLIDNPILVNEELRDKIRNIVYEKSSKRKFEDVIKDIVNRDSEKDEHISSNLMSRNFMNVLPTILRGNLVDKVINGEPNCLDNSVIIALIAKLYYSDSIEDIKIFSYKSDLHSDARHYALAYKQNKIEEKKEENLLITGGGRMILTTIDNVIKTINKHSTSGERQAAVHINGAKRAYDRLENGSDFVDDLSDTVIFD